MQYLVKLNESLAVDSSTIFSVQLKQVKQEDGTEPFILLVQIKLLDNTPHTLEVARWEYWDKEIAQKYYNDLVRDINWARAEKL